MNAQLSKLKGRLLCRAGFHNSHPHQATVTGPGLLYSKNSPGIILLRSVCIRAGCTYRDVEQWVCPITLVKALGVRNDV
jgi:hypothetical protein